MLVFALLFLLPGYAFAADIPHLQHHVLESRDKILVLEEKLDSEIVELERDRRLLKSMIAAGEGISRRKAMEAEMIVAVHEKKIPEWEEAIKAEKQQLKIWGLHLQRAKGSTLPAGTLETEYDSLWRLQGGLYRKMVATAKVQHDYEAAYHRDLKELSRTGAVAGKLVLEAEYRVKEMHHQWELAQKRAENADKFPN